MSFKIDGANGFISKLKNEGARSALFDVTCPLRGVNIAGADGDGNTLLKYMCKGATIPSSTVGVVTVNYFGRPVKFPGDRTYEELTLTIINDEGYAVRNRIENWMNKINDMDLNTRDKTMVGKQNYTSDLFLRPFTKDGNVAGASSWIFKNCFPTSLDAVDVAWESNDTIMEFTTTWSFDYWLHGDATGGSGSTPNPHTG